MFIAYSKKFNKNVHAFELFNNPTYQGHEKGDWIAPEDQIINWPELKQQGITEVPVLYVKEKEYSGKSQDVISVAPHFRLYPDSPAKTQEKSKMHRLIQEWLFSVLQEDKLEFVYSRAGPFENSVRLSQLQVQWEGYRIIENPIENESKSLRADLLIPFRVRDPVLGNGIDIEIQLSPQTDARTSERSMERARQGYSTVWLFPKDFSISDDAIVLTHTKLRVKTYLEELHNDHESLLARLTQQYEHLQMLLTTTTRTIQKQTEDFQASIDAAFDIVESKLRALRKEHDSFTPEAVQRIVQPAISRILSDAERQLRAKQSSALEEHQNKLVALIDKVMVDKAITTFAERNQEIISSLLRQHIREITTARAHELLGETFKQARDQALQHLSTNLNSQFDQLRAEIKQETLNKLLETFKDKHVAADMPPPPDRFTRDEIICDKNGCGRICYSGGFCYRGSKKLCIAHTQEFDARPF